MCCPRGCAASRGGRTCLQTLRAAVVPRTALLANAGRRAFVLLHGRLLDERLRLAVQVLRLGR
jgi:hypothetical protein